MSIPDKSQPTPRTDAVESTFSAMLAHSEQLERELALARSAIAPISVGANFQRLEVTVGFSTHEETKQFHEAMREHFRARSDGGTDK